MLWVEEPLAGEDLAGMRMLRESTGVRIAGGEMARSFDELRRALDADALDVFQPDVVLALGISGARTLAELALRRNRWFTPHTWTNGIGLLANLHVCCGVGGGPFLEYPLRPARLDPRSGATSCSPSRSRSTPMGSLQRSRRPRARHRARRGWRSPASRRSRGRCSRLRTEAFIDGRFVARRARTAPRMSTARSGPRAAAFDRGGWARLAAPIGSASACLLALAG